MKKRFYKGCDATVNMNVVFGEHKKNISASFLWKDLFFKKSSWNLKVKNIIKFFKISHFQIDQQRKISLNLSKKFNEYFSFNIKFMGLSPSGFNLNFNF